MIEIHNKYENNKSEMGNNTLLCVSKNYNQKLKVLNDQSLVD